MLGQYRGCLYGLAFVTVTALLASEGGADRLTYSGHKVYRIQPTSQEQVSLLEKIRRFNLDLDFWLLPFVGDKHIRHADVRVAPSQQANFTDWLAANNIKYHVMIDDVESLLIGMLPRQPDKPRQFGDIVYSEYNKFETVDEWVQELAQKYSSIAKLIVIGKTYEGRTIHAIHISGKSSNHTKPAFWMDGGIHAREWISPATVIYMLGHLLSGYGEDEKITNLIDAMDFYVLPVFNADGYVYTWEHNRMWRKTRKPNKGSTCVGTDPNRNWDWHWSESGASKDPCTDDYCGSEAFSEFCVKAVADYLKTIPNLQVFIDFHSYSELWMYPWAYIKATTKDFTVQDGAAGAAIRALEAVHGVKYEKGAIAEIIYVASGSTADWTYGAVNIVYSYGVELRDKGKHGFLLPADEIVPSGEETLAAIMALAEYVLDHQK